MEIKLTEDARKDTCPGLFFRCKETAFVSSFRSIERRKSLTFLKKPSCSGCWECSEAFKIIKEDLKEGYTDFMDKAVSGKAYQLIIKFHPGTYEYPDEGDYEITLSECPGLKRK